MSLPKKIIILVCAFILFGASPSSEAVTFRLKGRITGFSSPPDQPALRENGIREGDPFEATFSYDETADPIIAPSIYEVGVSPYFSLTVRGQTFSVIGRGVIFVSTTGLFITGNELSTEAHVQLPGETTIDEFNQVFGLDHFSLVFERTSPVTTRSLPADLDIDDFSSVHISINAYVSNRFDPFVPPLSLGAEVTKIKKVSDNNVED